MIFLTVIELKLKTAAAKTDQISIYVTLEIECDAFYFLTRGYAKRRNGFLLGLRYANVSLAHSGVESS